MFKRITKEIDSFFARDPAARSRAEIVLFYPGFHAIVVHRAAHYLWNNNWRLLAKFLASTARFITGIEIHPGARIGENLFIDHGMGVVVGETASIGNNVTIYHGVTLGGVSPQDSEKGSLRHPQIGNDVIIGSGAQLLGAIKVGDNARIGSNAVVVTDVEGDSIMVGVPARKVVKKAHIVEGDSKFRAYGGIEGEKLDPRQLAIDKLLEEVAILKNKVNELESQNSGIERTADNWKSE